MTTHLREQLQLTCTPGQFFARLGDRALLDERAALDPGFPSEVLEHLVEPAHVEIRTAATVPLGWLPRAAVRLAPAPPRVERLERWSLQSPDEVLGTMTCDIEGVSASASGMMRLTATPSGSDLAYPLELRVEVPVFGRVIEEALIRRIGKALRGEYAMLGGQG